MIKPSSFSRREVKVSVLAGALAALLVVLAGAAIAFTSTTKWTAESVLVVLPNADLSASDSAAYYETLSRGQIVATFAEVADNQRFQDQAEASLQLTDAQRAGVTTAVTVSAPTVRLPLTGYGRALRPTRGSTSAMLVNTAERGSLASSAWPPSSSPRGRLRPFAMAGRM